MSHSLKINLISDQCICIGLKEINIHDIQSIMIDERFNITEIITKTETIKTEQRNKKLTEITEIITQYGMIDGGHHKQWLLDQIMRIALGADYHEWLNDYNEPADYGEWDKGIAP